MRGQGPRRQRNTDPKPHSTGRAWEGSSLRMSSSSVRPRSTALGANYFLAIELLTLVDNGQGPKAREGEG